jgi:Fe-S-cluster containining protein
MAEADRAVDDAILPHRGRGLPVSCRKGCAACCRYLVRISVAEALRIREVVAGLPEDHRERVLSRSAEIREAAGLAGLTVDLERGLVVHRDDPGEAARMEGLARRYLALDLPCPFLDEGACSIYSDRPASCRQHCVSTPADLCVDPFEKNVRQIPVWPLVRDRLVRDCARITGEPPRMLPLSFL